MKVELLTLHAFKSEKILITATKGKGLKMLTPKQMPQRLPIAPAQVKAGNTPENYMFSASSKRNYQKSI